MSHLTAQHDPKGDIKFGPEPCATITSLRTPAAFQRTQEWMRALPTNHEDEVSYYVHAGIRPGVPLDQQTSFSLQSRLRVYSLRRFRFGQ
jgi:hypothetical protein